MLNDTVQHDEDGTEGNLQRLPDRNSPQILGTSLAKDQDTNAPRDQSADEKDYEITRPKLSQNPKRGYPLNSRDTMVRKTKPRLSAAAPTKASDTEHTISFELYSASVTGTAIKTRPHATLANLPLSNGQPNKELCNIKTTGKQKLSAIPSGHCAASKYPQAVPTASNDAAITGHVQLMESSPEVQGYHSPSTPPTPSFRLVGSKEALLSASNDLMSHLGPASGKKKAIAIDFTGAHDRLSLMAIATSGSIFVFDCAHLDSKAICEAIIGILNDSRILKVFHGLNRHMHAMATCWGVLYPLNCVFDTQLAIECSTGNPCMGFMEMLNHLQILPCANNGQRFPEDRLGYFANNAQLLFVALTVLESMIDGNEFTRIQAASYQRAATAMKIGGSRSVRFDACNSNALSSRELLGDSEQLLTPTRGLQVFHCASSLLKLLPKDLASKLSPSVQMNLTEIILDFGKTPYAMVNGQRMPMEGINCLVTTQDLRFVETAVGGFQKGTRAATLKGQLHLVSALRNQEGFVTGATIRVGRYVLGYAEMILDLLDTSKSILILGRKGSGKTTILREICRLLSMKSTVVIVDTKNELAGGDNQVHHYVGYSRRLMVPPGALEGQSEAMMEAIQNHSPHTLVVDELRVASAEEARVSQICKQQGIRLIAGTGGDLRTIIQETMDPFAGSSMACRLVGGPHPIFDCVVEIHSHHEWYVVTNTASAVAQVQWGHLYTAQKRSRNPNRGDILLDMIRL